MSILVQMYEIKKVFMPFLKTIITPSNHVTESSSELISAINRITKIITINMFSALKGKKNYVKSLICGLKNCSFRKLCWYKIQD